MEEFTDAGLVFAFAFDLADRLRKTLRVSGVSVSCMARALGLSRNTVGNWINGRGQPSETQLLVWAANTGAPLSWLETGEPPSSGAITGTIPVVLPIHRRTA